MVLRIQILLLALLFGLLGVEAQGLSLLVFTHDDELDSAIARTMTIRDRGETFYWNDLSTSYPLASWPRSSDSIWVEVRDREIAHYLAQQEVSKAILSTLLDRDDRSGTMDLVTLLDRGCRLTNNQQIGLSALEDRGFSALGANYILVLDYTTVAKDPVQQRWIVEVCSSLYHVNYDAVMAERLEAVWVDEAETPRSRIEKMEQYNNLPFGCTQIGRSTVVVSESLAEEVAVAIIRGCSAAMDSYKELNPMPQVSNEREIVEPKSQKIGLTVSALYHTLLGVGIRIDVPIYKGQSGVIEHGILFETMVKSYTLADFGVANKVQRGVDAIRCSLGWGMTIRPLRFIEIEPYLTLYAESLALPMGSGVETESTLLADHLSMGSAMGVSGRVFLGNSFYLMVGADYSLSLSQSGERGFAGYYEYNQCLESRGYSREGLGVYAGLGYRF